MTQTTRLDREQSQLISGFTIGCPAHRENNPPGLFLVSHR